MKKKQHLPMLSFAELVKNKYKSINNYLIYKLEICLLLKKLYL